MALKNPSREQLREHLGLPLAATPGSPGNPPTIPPPEQVHPKLRERYAACYPQFAAVKAGTKAWPDMSYRCQSLWGQMGLDFLANE